MGRPPAEPRGTFMTHAAAHRATQLPFVRSLGLAWLVVAASVSACGSDDAKDEDTYALPVDTVGGGDVAADVDSGDVAGSDSGGADVTVPPGHPTVVKLGKAGRLLLRGHIVSPDKSYKGEVLVDAGLIVCAAPSCADHAMAADATILDTQGIIAPGLIDLHNHILFDIFDDDDWLPKQLYTNHNQWPKEDTYAEMLDVKQCLTWASQGRPAWCPGHFEGDGRLTCEMDKWGELKGLVAGTTSIVGLPGTSSACFGSLARSIDVAQNDLGDDYVQASALFPPGNGNAVCKNFDNGKTRAYLIHCGEGLDETARSEFDLLGTTTDPDGCLYAPQTVITHGTAFGDAEFEIMANAGMKLTWSPASNVALYGDTTNIPKAIDHGVVVTLGPDWSMGGSQNMLDELRFADDWDNAKWGDVLSPQDLLEMATINAAAALSLADKLGRIEVGYIADLFVYTGDATKPYDALLAATPAQVQLVLVGGVALYGDIDLEAAAPAEPGCDHLKICGAIKFLCAAEDTKVDKLGQSSTEIRDILQAALEEIDAVAKMSRSFAPLAPLVRCD